MAPRPKEAHGKKLIYRYSAPVIFTLLFSLMVIGVVVASLFLPYMSIQESPTVVSQMVGLDFYKIYINLFTQGDNTAYYNFYNLIATNSFDNFIAAGPAINVLVYFIGFDFIIMALLSVILVVACLVMIFSGRLHNWKICYSVAKRVWIASIFYYGVPVGLNIFNAIKSKAQYDALYTYIFFGGLLLLVISLHIIYSVSFKNHIYVKNEATLNRYLEEYEKQNVVTDTSKDHKAEDVVIQSAPKPAPKIIPADPKEVAQKNQTSENRKYLPKGLKSIGGHAFSQNTALEEANIPLGIEVLGAGAFANCVNLKVVHIPESVKKIEYNCFFNCMRLERITYGGSREMWKRVKCGSNWLTSAGTKFIVCRDGALSVNIDN